jgi:hypothetical protein
LAACEGEISGIGRIWADGMELDHAALNFRVYVGDETQLPDPLISAIEGNAEAPAYRGIAYVVIEDLELGPYGNRIPQFNFEVHRPEVASGDLTALETSRGTSAVALLPGTGEYALATTPVYTADERGARRAVNVNSLWGRTDFLASMAALRRELPACEAVSLVVSWFGDDLRCGSCLVQPKVEQGGPEFASMPWQVSGITRYDASVVPKLDGRPVYGGTPTDQSVMEAIRSLKAEGKAVMFYPFLLMDQLVENNRTDPWTGAASQPALPWRGRITTSVAPSRSTSIDKTATAESEVAEFFGSTEPKDLNWNGAKVVASGSADWRYRRFILHYARLCAAAGGVDAFCIGSEMRGLTQIRGPGASYPAVSALQRLLADVREILGPAVKLSYAADWSEYFGHHPQDGSGDVFFHLDPLWADTNVDFVGIDNYMPLSDWRDGENHADAEYGSIYNAAYLGKNVAGGEGFDWYYETEEAREEQIRTPISDGAYGEAWVFRYKDIRAWWSNAHHDRPGGVRSATSTPWIPMSKPIWFTEYGCPAVDKGTNEPNKFFDPKSSESFLPRHSNGRRDDLVQRRYLEAVRSQWTDEENNPVSSFYDGRMINLSRAFVWAFDARPFPAFPNARSIWSDGENYGRGHWLNGRTTARELSGVVSEICRVAGVPDVDVSRLYGIVSGYVVGEIGSARSVLQPLMQAYGFDALEREGRLEFRSRSARRIATIDLGRVTAAERVGDDLVIERSQTSELPSRVRATYVDAEGAYVSRAVEAADAAQRSVSVSQMSLGLLLTADDAQAMVDRWLAEMRVSVEAVKFGLPPSAGYIGPGDVVGIGEARFRVDRVEIGAETRIEALRTDPSIFTSVNRPVPFVIEPTFSAETPVDAFFLDIPLITEGQFEHAPVVAVSNETWRGPVAVYQSANGDSFQFNSLVENEAVIGRTLDPLTVSRSDLWDNGPAVRVQLRSARSRLSSASREDVLNGANVAAIGTGSPGEWEIFQFRTADLVASETYSLSCRLRGRYGTDATALVGWPAGSIFVLLKRDLLQLDYPLDLRGLERIFRIGPADRPPSDALYVERRAEFLGVGMRPLSPVHLKVRPVTGGMRISWIRRTRIGGDSWLGHDVPLGESSERYLLRISASGALQREVEISGSSVWDYPSALIAEDWSSGPMSVEVSQVSEVFGLGPAARITING